MENTVQVLYKRRENVGEILFNRPPANAYNLAFMQDFQNAILAANEDNETSSVIIKSASEKFFCAGADIKEFQQNSTEDNQKLVVMARRNTDLIENSNKVFVAQLSGHTLGGGLEIAMACDIRFAAEGNYLFGLPEIKLGLIPGNGGTQRLARIVGSSRALEILATGDNFSVKQAKDYGLVNKVMSKEQLETETFNYAKRISDGPRLAVAATKKAINQGIQLSMQEGLELENRLVNDLYDTHDADEGFVAFLEKRAPVFQGK